MAEYSKLGYGNAADVDAAIEKGIIDGKDLVITKDTSEFLYIRDDKTKQVIRPRCRIFGTPGEANAALNDDPTTYGGQTVMILDDTGKYSPYVVQKLESGKFVVEPFVMSSTNFTWTEF